MTGIQFVTDEKGRKTGVLIDLKKHGAIAISRGSASTHANAPFASPAKGRSFRRRRGCCPTGFSSPKTFSTNFIKRQSIGKEAESHTRSPSKRFQRPSTKLRRDKTSLSFADRPPSFTSILCIRPSRYSLSDT